MNMAPRTQVEGSSRGRAMVLAALALPAILSIQCVSHPVGGVWQPIAESTEESVVRMRDLARGSHIDFLEQCLGHYRRSYKDYRCTLLKQERLGGVVGPEQEIAIKFRDSPFSVAMAWVANPDLGDRLLYVEGRYGGQMLVRPAGLVAQLLAGKTARREPNSEEVRRRSLRSATEFGFQRGLVSLLEVYRLARQNGDLKEEMGQDANVGGRRTFVLVRLLPRKTGYPARKTVLYIDQEWLVPILVEGYGWRDEEFLCRYLNKDVQFNVGLTDEDFRPESNDLQSPDGQAAPAPGSLGGGR